MNTERVVSAMLIRKETGAGEMKKEENKESSPRSLDNKKWDNRKFIGEEFRDTRVYSRWLWVKKENLNCGPQNKGWHCAPENLRGISTLTFSTPSHQNLLFNLPSKIITLCRLGNKKEREKEICPYGKHRSSVKERSPVTELHRLSCSNQDPRTKYGVQWTQNSSRLIQRIYMKEAELRHEQQLPRETTRCFYHPVPGPQNPLISDPRKYPSHPRVGSWNHK